MLFYAKEKSTLQSAPSQDPPASVAMHDFPYDDAGVQEAARLTAALHRFRQAQPFGSASLEIPLYTEVLEPGTRAPLDAVDSVCKGSHARSRSGRHRGRVVPVTCSHTVKQAQVSTTCAGNQASYMKH